MIAPRNQAQKPKTPLAVDLDRLLLAGRAGAASRLPPPIRSVSPGHRERIAQHLLALDERDRYLRFGYVASDEQIRRYVSGLDFGRDEVFGIYDRRLALIAVAHLAFLRPANRESQPCAEFGVSVAARARGRGYGSRLFERAAVRARNEGVEFLFIHALGENTAMLSIARKAGATIVLDGPEAAAHLRLPPATLDSLVSEFVQERVARTDYRLKAQAKRWRRWLGGL